MQFESTRLEAFSDGVFAIAITLLVLDLKVQPKQGQSLAAALGHQWPAYGAYVVSFAVIGIIWINHHTVFRNVRAVDRPVLFANLFLLGVVSVLPFPTSLLAENLTHGWDGNVAALIYTANMLLLSVAFSVLWLLITRERAALLHEQIDAAQARSALRRFGLGFFAYSAAMVVAAFSALAVLVVHAVFAGYYCFDQLAVRATRSATGEPGAGNGAESRVERPAARSEGK